MYCPKCGDVLSNDPEVGCRRGGMALSRALHAGFVACFQDRSREPSTVPLPFRVGGSWFCPACGSPTHERVPGDVRCPTCNRALNEFMQALIELHPHAALEVRE